MYNLSQIFACGNYFMVNVWKRLWLGLETKTRIVNHFTSPLAIDKEHFLHWQWTVGTDI